MYENVTVTSNVFDGRCRIGSEIIPEREVEFEAKLNLIPFNRRVLIKT